MEDHEVRKTENIEQPMNETDMKQCGAIILKLKRNPNVGPFLKPVDPVELGIPDYFDKIKHPMDISTIKSKLDKKEYTFMHEFVSDFQLMFDNCFSYNHPESLVSTMCRDLQSAFETMVNDDKRKKEREPRKRPKVEENSMKAEDYAFCQEALSEIEKQKHRRFTWPFLAPVSEEDAPGYFEVIKTPMDLGRIRTKLDKKEYNSLVEFTGDLGLVVQNCLKYNPKETEVFKCGEELSRLVAQVLNTNKKDLETRIDELRNQISILQQELQQLENQSTNVVYPLPERERVGRLIKGLKPFQMKNIERIIHRTGAFEYVDVDEIVINLLTMKDDVVAELDEYLKKLESGEYASESISEE